MLENFSSHEKQILQKCFYCMCETYPLCSFDGQVCNYCFDVFQFAHKNKNPNAWGEYETHDQNLAIEGNNSGKECPENPKLFVIPSDPDGDCLYSSISNAFHGKISPQQLRYLVASRQTSETWESYKSIYPEMLSKIKTCRQFKNILQRCGKEYGAYACIWGDENALQIISDEFLLDIIVFDHSGSQISHIKPYIEPEQPPHAKRFILLILDNRSDRNPHYNLLRFDNKRVLSEQTWCTLHNFLTRKANQGNNVGKK